jgi:glycosyltransferase involved in cell wall biosynthesis
MAQELDLDLSCVELCTSSDMMHLPKADLLISMGNEVLPPVRAFAKRNFFICQFPFPMHPNHVAAAWGWLEGYDAVIVYSAFSAEHFRKRAAAYTNQTPPVVVLAPPAPSYFTSSPIERIGGRILNVGRFTPHGHCKRQDSVVKAFRSLVDQTQRNDLELHLVGTVGADPDSRDYLFEVRKLAKQYPVYFHLSAAPQTLEHLYQTSSQYWHATGHGVSENYMPERMEHFGISVLEAMSAGTIPLVYNQAGPASLVEDAVSGYHWNSIEALVQRSGELLVMPDEMREEMRATARHQARRFDSDSFERNLLTILNEWDVGVKAEDYAPSHRHN